jgi:flavin reductase (DIM6/NTAB) family NADH-FMN oxidoreductase RutF
MTIEESDDSAIIEQRAYRDTIGLFASGVTVITTRLGDVIHGMTANAVSSVSLNPTLLLVCVDRRSHLHDLIQQTSIFAVNILAADQVELADHFAGRARGEATPSTLRFRYGNGDNDDGSVPTIAGCLTALRCTVEAMYPGGDHTILIGRVIELRMGDPVAQPLIWFGGNYRRLTAAETTA